MQYILNLIVVIVGCGIIQIIFKVWIPEQIKHGKQKQLEDHKGSIYETQKKMLEVWLIKRDACMKALNLANAVLSHYSYKNTPNLKIVRQYVTIDQARACMNELSCSCVHKEVIHELKRIIQGNNVSPDAIVDLRNAVRKELDFSDTMIDDDRENAFIANLNCIQSE